MVSNLQGIPRCIEIAGRLGCHVTIWHHETKEGASVSASLCCTGANGAEAMLLDTDDFASLDKALKQLTEMIEGAFRG